MRTRKSALKRFKVTKTGKVLHRGQGAKHLKSNKSKRVLRGLKNYRSVQGKMKVKIKNMMGV